jgi:rhamnogalacturonan acetylesterase
MLRFSILILSIMMLTSGILGEKKQKSTIWLIGDSTVKNGSGKGQDGLWGWGDRLYTVVDTNKIIIRNHAIGGRSSRTFLAEGRWDVVLEKLKPGDYVVMQFGHNDNGPINDNFRARGTIKGTGEETEEIDNILTKKHEIIHSFGWYMRKYCEQTKAKGAIPIVCSRIPGNSWAQEKTIQANEDYAKWAEETAIKENAFYVNLNKIIAQKYDIIGEAEVTSKYFLTDHTHTNEAGAILNAKAFAEGIALLRKCGLRKYLIK